MIDELLVLVDDLIVALDSYLVLTQKGGSKKEIEEHRKLIKLLVRQIKNHGIGHRSKL